MKNRIEHLTLAVLIGMCVVSGVGRATAASAPEPAKLTAEGQKLQTRYAEMLAALKADITKAVPALDAQKIAAYVESRKAEKDAEAALAKTQQELGKVGGAQALIGHAKGKWIGGAEKGIAAAEAALKKATTDAEREAAQKDLASWQKNKEDGLKELKAREDKLAAALRDEPQWIKERDAAQKALDEAKARTSKAVDAFEVNALLASDKLDSQLAKYVVLFEATPEGLAKYAEQGAEQAALVDSLLANSDLMKQMLVSDCPAGNNYGPAMAIYTAIQKASPKAKEGVLQHLALAVALVHAAPIKQGNPADQKQAPETVDPVKRYLAYEKAYVDGELDPAFKSLTAWDLRFVVDGDEPDEVSAWGREMLRNYRPDIILDPDTAWRYVNAVRTDVKYGSQDQKYDRPNLQNFQNIIMNGGICGRRAFFGRFILRAFGIPTTARPQTGHGALIHWTPTGWVPCLGAGWGSGRTPTRYHADMDFLVTSQARATGEPYLQVKRAQWIGDVFGEKRVFGFIGNEPGPWYGASLYRQQAIVEASKAKTLGAVGSNLAEANESTETKAAAVVKAVVTDADKKVAVSANGVITIPAAACGGVQPTKSFLGGLQAFCAASITCDVDAPKAGKYQLTARIVTVRDSGKIQLTVNNAKELVDVAIPYTVGKWEQTQPVEVTLIQGKNTLVFSKPVRGFTLKEITLTPVK